MISLWSRIRLLISVSNFQHHVNPVRVRGENVSTIKHNMVDTPASECAELNGTLLLVT